MRLKIFTLGIVLIFMGSIASAQKNTTDSLDFYTLSLEELMNIQIVSASKKSESLFDASLSASVLTREEIKNAGATSIMEALRLMPGLIVREQTNGNYDVHIRGLDNVPPNSLILSSTNTTTLVMINNRPVYNYLQGGTFWESLPIDLNDVEKIEVIRGPSSTLYGPNAVSGVINIITTKLSKAGLSIRGNGQYGSKQTSIANSTIGYKFNDKLDVAVSGNFQSRGRDVRYLDYATYKWVNSPQDINVSNPDVRYPHPDKSMIKSGANVFANYTPGEKLRFSVASGLQDSEVQNIMFDNSVANLGTTATNSRYVDFQASTYGLNTQVSYASAVQSPVRGMLGSKYDYRVADVSLEYDIHFKDLSIKPGFTYRSANYNDASYWDISKGEGSLGGEQVMKTYGGGVRIDYKLLQDKMRFTGGIRRDKFTYPNKWFTSYQAALSYKISDKNLVRAVYSKAYRSPFIFDTYLNYKSQNEVAPGIFSEFTVSGNKNLKLVYSNMMEVGYRSKLMNNLSLDIEAYYTQTQNYATIIQGATTLTPANYPIVASSSLSIENIPMKVQQAGASASLTLVVDKFQIKPFVTLQKTTLKDYSPYFSTSTAAPSASNKLDPATNNVNSGIGTTTDHKFTPKIYGGAYINYSISSKFNFNVNAYFFSNQTFYESKNTTYNDGIHGVDDIRSKALVNAKLSYLPVKGVSVFVTGKNLLAQKTSEYYKGDAIPTMVLGGIGIDL